MIGAMVAGLSPNAAQAQAHQAQANGSPDNWQQHATEPERPRLLVGIIAAISQQADYIRDLSMRVRVYADEVFGPASEEPSPVQPVDEPQRPLSASVNMALSRLSHASGELDRQLARLGPL